jgi:NitT/TauT family transport system ATP-binding protein
MNNLSDFKPTDSKHADSKPASLPLLTCNNLTFGYSKELVLKDISFQLEQAQVLSILGPSGCGKSTLLKLAGSFLHPRSGEVLIEGVRVHEPDAKRVMVFQQIDQLFPWKTVLANVMFSLQHLPTSQARERALEVLDEVGMIKAKDKYPAELSGGMAQRTALARSLAGEPRLLLMDEPFGAVDALQRKELQQLLLRLIASHHTAVLFVTHDIDEALLLGHQILVLNNQGCQLGLYKKQELSADRLEALLKQDG